MASADWSASPAQKQFLWETFSQMLGKTGDMTDPDLVDMIRDQYFTSYRSNNDMEVAPPSRIIIQWAQSLRAGRISGVDIFDPYLSVESPPPSHNGGFPLLPPNGEGFHNLRLRESIVATEGAGVEHRYQDLQYSHSEGSVYLPGMSQGVNQSLAMYNSSATSSVPEQAPTLHHDPRAHEVQNDPVGEDRRDMPMESAVKEHDNVPVKLVGEDRRGASNGPVDKERRSVSDESIDEKCHGVSDGLVGEDHLKAVNDPVDADKTNNKHNDNSDKDGKDEDDGDRKRKGRVATLSRDNIYRKVVRIKASTLYGQQRRDLIQLVDKQMREEQLPWTQRLSRIAAAREAAFCGLSKEEQEMWRKEAERATAQRLREQVPITLPERMVVCENQVQQFQEDTWTTCHFPTLAIVFTEASGAARERVTIFDTVGPMNSFTAHLKDKFGEFAVTKLFRWLDSYAASFGGEQTEPPDSDNEYVPKAEGPLVKTALKMENGANVMMDTEDIKPPTVKKAKKVAGDTEGKFRSDHRHLLEKEVWMNGLQRIPDPEDISHTDRRLVYGEAMRQRWVASGRSAKDFTWTVETYPTLFLRPNCLPDGLLPQVVQKLQKPLLRKILDYLRECETPERFEEGLIYSNPADVTDVLVDIKDADGNIIRKGLVPKTLGTYALPTSPSSTTIPTTRSDVPAQNTPTIVASSPPSSVDRLDGESGVGLPVEENPLEQTVPNTSNPPDKQVAKPKGKGKGKRIAESLPAHAKDAHKLPEQPISTSVDVPREGAVPLAVPGVVERAFGRGMRRHAPTPVAPSMQETPEMVEPSSGKLVQNRKRAAPPTDNAVEPSKPKKARK